MCRKSRGKTLTNASCLRRKQNGMDRSDIIVEVEKKNPVPVIMCAHRELPCAKLRSKVFEVELGLNQAFCHRFRSATAALVKSTRSRSATLWSCTSSDTSTSENMDAKWMKRREMKGSTAALFKMLSYSAFGCFGHPLICVNVSIVWSSPFYAAYPCDFTVNMSDKKK